MDDDISKIHAKDLYLTLVIVSSKRYAGVFI